MHQGAWHCHPLTSAPAPPQTNIRSPGDDVCGARTRRPCHAAITPTPSTSTAAPASPLAEEDGGTCSPFPCICCHPCCYRSRTTPPRTNPYATHRTHPNSHGTASTSTSTPPAHCTSHGTTSTATTQHYSYTTLSTLSTPPSSPTKYPFNPGSPSDRSPRSGSTHITLNANAAAAPAAAAPAAANAAATAHAGYLKTLYSHAAVPSDADCSQASYLKPFSARPGVANADASRALVFRSQSKFDT